MYDNKGHRKKKKKKKHSYIPPYISYHFMFAFVSAFNRSTVHTLARIQFLNGCSGCFRAFLHQCFRRSYPPWSRSTTSATTGSPITSDQRGCHPVGRHRCRSSVVGARDPPAPSCRIRVDDCRSGGGKPGPWVPPRRPPGPLLKVKGLLAAERAGRRFAGLELFLVRILAPGRDRLAWPAAC